MTELYIALNKQNYEGLINGETNEVVIKKNDWWKKRLMDLDTGVFKKFDVASISCGSAEKIQYDIEKIELRGNKFIITVNTNKGDAIDLGIDEGNVVDLDGSEYNPEDNDEFIELAEPEVVEPEVIEPEVVAPEIIEPVTVNPVVVNEDGSVTQKSVVVSDDQKKAIIEKFKQEVKTIEKEQKTPDVKVRVLKLLDSFCEQKDVFVVNMSNVTIRFNGQIVGYHGGRRLIADRDSDVRIDFKNHELVKYYDMSDDDFILEVQAFLNQLLKNSYVFINKKYCNFYTTTNGELIFRVTAVAKKKYLFR